MRVAIVPGFAAEGTEDERPSSLSGWAEEEKFRSQLGFVPAQLTAGDAIARMLNLGSGQQTLVVQLRGYEMLTPEQAELLDRGFSEVEQEVSAEIEHWLSEARQLAQDPSPDSQEAARGRYAKVNRALRYELSPRRALVLMELADLERRSGNTKEARALLDHAIAISPRQAALLERRATLARDTGESAVAVAMMQRLLYEVEASDEDRANLSATLARESLSAARQALELALKLRPGDKKLLEQLKAVHEASGMWGLAVGTAVELAERIEDRPKRAQALVAAAQLCSARTGNIPRAVALYEAAIEDDPEVPGAFSAVEAELLRVGDQRGVASAYERQIDRLAQQGAKEAQGNLLRKLAELECTELRDNKAAIRALERLVELLPDDPEARFALAKLLEEEKDDPGAIRALEAAARSAPKALAVYQRLHALLSRGDDDDRVYLASSALVALGEADINEQLSYTQYAPEGLPKNAKPFEDDIWEALLPKGHPRHVDELMRVLEPAAMELWFEKVAPSLGSMLPDEKHRVNSKRSTVSAVRCFRWASQLLGVDEPVLYVEPDNVRVSVATLPTPDPALLLGRPVLSGRSVVELSFIAVHHLAYSRPEWRALAFWTDPVRLQALMTAGISLVKPNLEASLSEYGHTMRADLADRMDPEARPELEDAVEGLLSNGAKLDLNGWARSVEKSACRAALLASGDVTVAGSVLAVLGAPLGGQSAADRARDLLPFTVSHEFSELRKRLALAVS